ncbi:MAG: ribosome recycling factor [Candidatus Campbellbacteria bacterium]|nr:ribosome recycling factor [Candidatus Campbellbacteria bacterium]
MAFDFTEFKDHIGKTEKWLSNEFSMMRTGRASLSVLDGVKVNNYGSIVPLNTIATLSIEDPRTISVNVWDSNVIGEVEKAITKADLGLSVSVTDAFVRVSFPEITSENKALLLKKAKEKHEEARISIRQIRDKIWNTIQKQQKDKEINEDEKFRYKNEMEKLVDETHKKLQAITEQKEKELQ